MTTSAVAKKKRATDREFRAQVEGRKSMMFHRLTREEASEMGKRSKANRVRNQVYMIEGESVTIFQIAELMGKSTNSAYAKFKKVRDANPRVTWALLGVAK